MNYYAYEYSVLQLLFNELKYINVDIDSEITEAYAWVHNNNVSEYTRVVPFVRDRIITINFEHDFHFAFNTKILTDAYESNIEAEEIILVLKQKIINAFTKEFILK